MEYVTCGHTEFVVRELPEKLRILNTIDPDSGDSLLVAQFKVCVRVRACVRCEKLFLVGGLPSIPSHLGQEMFRALSFCK